VNNNSKGTDLRWPDKLCPANIMEGIGGILSGKKAGQQAHRIAFKERFPLADIQALTLFGSSR